LRPGHASRTAQHNALFRALETRRPAAERIVTDPIAGVFLSRDLRAVVALAGTTAGRAVALGIIDRGWPGTRTSLIARTRLIDELVSAQASAVDQIVILGAGFDTRAWRLEAFQRGATVIEVDHPDTQARKRAVLDRREIATAHVRFVPTDFHLGRLATAIADADYRPSSPTLFLWEGTTNYLDAETVDATLRWCASAATGSRVVFTYIDRDVLDDPSRYHGAAKMLDGLARAGEPMTFGLDPATLAAYLAERRLTLTSDTGAGDYRARFYGDAARTIRGHEFYRVATADVACS
jgi:methyltransferase (TIGR00027 family)